MLPKCQGELHGTGRPVRHGLPSGDAAAARHGYLDLSQGDRPRRPLGVGDAQAAVALDAMHCAELPATTVATAESDLLPAMQAQCCER